MGKPTGFLEFERKINPCREVGERVRDFREFKTALDAGPRREQAARCMNCGVPFCQSGEKFGRAVSGCPLHNLIPEWNDLIYKGRDKEALERLTKVNPFPEFTGRVCPALCEAGCTCGLNGEPVTVHDNELYLAELGFEKGFIHPQPPAKRCGKRVAVIGSGPAGLAAAYRLNRLGYTVNVYERAGRAGGLLTYGIPCMKLEKAVVERRISLMEAEGVTFVLNTDVGSADKASEILAANDAVILCCGAKKPRNVNFPGREGKGIHFAVDYLSSVTETLLGGYEAFPIDAKGKSVVVIGGGDTGNDCVGTAIRQGCKSVVQLEMMPRPPKTRAKGNEWPQWQNILRTDYGQTEAAAVFGRDPRLFRTTVSEAQGDAEGNIISVTAVTQSDDGGAPREQRLECDLLLIAAGFIGCEDYVASAFGLERDGRGNISCPESHVTANPKVFSAGDARTGQSLVVRAIADGLACADEVDSFLK